MTTVTSGSTQAFTANVKGETITCSINAGQATVTLAGSSTATHKLRPAPMRRTFGPFQIGDTCTVQAETGDVIVEFGTASPNSSGAAQPGTGGGAVSSVAGKTGAVTLAATDVGAVATPTNWAAGTNTPALTSGTAVVGTAFKNTTAGTTTLGTAIDGITVVNQGDMLVCFTAGAYTLVPANNILAPRTLGSTYSLVPTDNGVVFNTPVNCTVTVPNSLGAGFGCGFMGAGVVTFAGAATVTDNRKTGSTAPFCGLICSAADTYQARGEKA